MLTVQRWNFVPGANGSVVGRQEVVDQFYLGRLLSETVGTGRVMFDITYPAEQVPLYEVDTRSHKWRKAFDVKFILQNGEEVTVVTGGHVTPKRYTYTGKAGTQVVYVAVTTHDLLRHQVETNMFRPIPSGTEVRVSRWG